MYSVDLTKKSQIQIKYSSDKLTHVYNLCYTCEFKWNIFFLHVASVLEYKECIKELNASSCQRNERRHVVQPYLQHYIGGDDDDDDAVVCVCLHNLKA